MYVKCERNWVDKMSYLCFWIYCWVGLVMVAIWLDMSIRCVHDDSQ